MRFLVLFFVALAPACLCAQVPTARFSYPTSETELARPEWRRDFVRVVGRIPLVPGEGTLCADELARYTLPPEVAGNYLTNQAAAAMHWYAWLRGELDMTYEDALREQHRIAATGPDGKTFYWKNGAGVPYRSDAVSPGKFRVEISGKPMFGGDSFQLKPDEMARLRRHGFRIPPRMLPVGLVPRSHLVATEFTDAVNGLGQRALPVGRAELEYRKEASKRARAIRRWMDLSPAEARPFAAEIVEELAHAYYAALHWMPFDAINNSILMDQVNVALRHFGFVTLEHRRLDFLAVATTPDVFVKLVLEDFREANPDLF